MPKGTGSQSGGPGAGRPARPRKTGPRTGDDIHTLDDLRAFAAELRGKNLYTHATRSQEALENIVKTGLDAPASRGGLFSTPTIAPSTGPDGERLTPVYVRDLGSGYVVFRGSKGRPSVDVIEQGLRYPETVFKERVPPRKIAKVVRSVSLPDGSRIREDLLASYALANQGLNNQEVRDLPAKYQRWFALRK